jgi:hypothetical protein
MYFKVTREVFAPRAARLAADSHRDDILIDEHVLSLIMSFARASISALS